MKALSTFIIFIAATLSAYAQSSDSVWVQPVDSGMEQRVQDFLEAEEQRKKINEARKVISSYEKKMLQKEMSMTYDGAQLLIRGVWPAFTEKNFMDIDCNLKGNNHSVRDYAIGLSPLAATWIMKAAGVKSRSKTQRMLTANAIGLGLTFAISQGMKYGTKELRPDGTDKHSMPSGHTAAAFSAATILHREYGHISPWISVGGYTMATATQMLRIRSNCHWMHDTFMGAGIGCVATNFAYFLSDKIFGKDGINRPRMTMGDVQRTLNFAKEPSSVAMISSVEAGKRRIDSDCYDICSPMAYALTLRSSATMSAGVEYTCFINNNFALDVNGRISTAMVKAEKDQSLPMQDMQTYGCNLDAYHVNVAAKYSLPILHFLRISGRVSMGDRQTTKSSITAVTNGQNDEQTLLKIRATNAFEAGAGMAIDMFADQKFITGVTVDYNHAFSKLMPNRWVIGMQWRVML